MTLITETNDEKVIIESIFDCLILYHDHISKTQSTMIKFQNEIVLTSFNTNWHRSVVVNFFLDVALNKDAVFHFCSIIVAQDM